MLHCVLLGQRGAFLVSDNYKLAYALQTLGNQAVVWRYAGRLLQLSNVEPIQECSAPAANQATYGWF